MPFPERLLLPGEEVLLDARPRMVRLARPVLLVLCVLAAGVAAVLAWSSAPIWFGWVLLGAIGASFLDLAARAAQWRAESLTVTSRRVVWRAGVLRRRGRDIPIASVQSVSYRQGLVQQLLRVGDLVVEAAGEASREPIRDVPDPARVQGVVSLAMDRSRAFLPPGAPAWSASTPVRARGPRGAPWTDWAAAAGGVPGAPGAAAVAPDTAPTPAVRGDDGRAAGEVVDALERLAALYDRGVLTRGELEAAKAELLGRR